MNTTRKYITKHTALLISAGLLVLLGACLYLLIEKPQPKITEIAQGVFTRQLEYQNANQTFVIFDNYVVVFDPGYVMEARALLDEIKFRTDKPVKYVISSHFHPDHAAGASVFEAEGAEAIAGAKGKHDYEIWARNLFNRRVKEKAEGYALLNYPAFRYIEKPLILDDGKIRMEIKHYGHAHTQGDLLAWLPKQGVLLVTDVANNGPLNLANADISKWIAILKKLANMPIEVVVPGHGKLGGREILDMNIYFLSEMKTEITKMVKNGMGYYDILDEIEIPAYKERFGEKVRDNPTNVKRVFLEVGGVLGN